MFNVQLLSGVLSTKMRECHLKITRNSPMNEFLSLWLNSKILHTLKNMRLGFTYFQNWSMLMLMLTTMLASKATPQLESNHSQCNVHLHSHQQSTWPITYQHIQELFYNIKTCPWSCVQVGVNLICPFYKIMSIFQLVIKSSIDMNSSFIIFVAISVS